jgi:phosphatidylglycerol---prolipoprotein diacylglyceryl transferase
MKIMPNPVAFTLLNLDIRWYGILVATGIALGTLVFYIRGPKRGIPGDTVLDILIISIPVGVVCARLYYVLFNWNYFAMDPIQILNIRGGGLAIHGGLLGGLLAAWFITRYKHIKFLDMTDAVVPGFALAQAIGRWGNYFNSEAHGGPTDLPWGIMVDGVKVHPTFLYESIWCFLLFLFLIWFDKKPRFAGQIACLYGILYSVERFFVEALRTDSLMFGPFKQAQLLSLTVIIVCTLLYFYLRRRSLQPRSIAGQAVKKGEHS